MKDYYNILNLSPQADASEIRRAFRNMAFNFHPDIAGDDPETTEAFIAIREAYEVLSNEDRRAKYNQEWESYHKNLKQKKQTCRPQSVPHHPRRPKRGFTSPFSRKKEAFSQRRQQRKPTHHSRPKIFQAKFIETDLNNLAEQDINGSLEIQLEESIRNTVYTINLQNNLNIPNQINRYQIQLPKGIYPGAKLKIDGLGHFSKNSPQTGDLYIDVVFAKHQSLRLCGGTLFYDLVIYPWQAALGCSVEIPTLEDIESVQIPPNISNPAIKRLEGRGMFRSDGKRGDLWINIKVEVPPPTSYRARRLWAELAEEHRNSQRFQ